MERGPPDDALLVRGGLMRASDLATSAEVHWEQHRSHALSFWTIPGLSADEIAATVGMENLPHAKIRCAPAGRLRRLGYEVMFSEPRPMHVSVVLPSPPSDKDWKSIDNAFDAPAKNPVARPRRP